MKTISVLALLMFSFPARADDIVDLNVQSTWVRNYNQPNLPNRESLTYNFVDRWDETTGQFSTIYASETGNPTPLMYFEFGQGSISQYGAFFPSAFGAQDYFQIIPYYNYAYYDPNATPWGSPGFNAPAEVDIFCGSDVCKNFLGDGDFEDGQANISSISITPITNFGCGSLYKINDIPCNTDPPPQNTPEMSTGAMVVFPVLAGAIFAWRKRKWANS